MKNFFSILFIALVSTQSLLAADLQELKSKKIADFFIYTAQNVIAELATKTDKIEYGDESISVRELAVILKESTVEVQYSDLIDNTGSLVDALGTDHKVILAGNTWAEFLKTKKDIRLLVLHEVLRMAQINDNNYVYSLNVLPTQASENKLAPYCNLRVQTTEVVYTGKQFSGSGSTTPNSKGYFTGEAPDSTEAKVNAYKDLKERCDKKGYTEGPTNLRATMAMTLENSNGMITNKYEVKMTGQCFKPENVSRNKEAQRNEICSKVDLCRNILNDSQTTESEDFDRISKLTSKWKC